VTPLWRFLLTGFGRAIAEVGAIIIVGGNIAGVTRTAGWSAARALGMVLLGLSLAVTGAIFLMARRLILTR
jgi:ABC-type tungstate transport system substrate-binding protein